VTLQNTSTHVAQATVNGSHATTFAVANAMTAGGDATFNGAGTGLTVTNASTLTGAVTATNAGNNIAGAFNGTVGAGTPSTGAFTTLSSTGTTTIDNTGGNAVNIGSGGTYTGTISIGDSATGNVSTTSIKGNVNFGGPVTFPAGSVSSASFGLAKNDIFIGDATSATADTAMMTQDVTLQNTSTHVAQATVNGSHATTFAVANAMTVGGDATFNGAGTGLTVTNATTLTGAVTATNASNTIAGAFNGTVGASTPSTGVFTTLTASGNANIDASPSSGGIVNIGNAAGPSTTNIYGTVSFGTAPTFPSGSVSNTELAHSTIGVTSTGSTLTVTGSPISLGSTGNVDLNLTTANTWTAQIAVQKNAIAITPTNAYIASNTTVSTNSVKVQMSPSYEMGAHVWGNGADSIMTWHIYNLPTSAAVPTSIIEFDEGNVAGGLSKEFSMSNGGVFSAATGYSINFANATSGHYLRGNGANYVDGTIQSGDLPSSLPSGETIPSPSISNPTFSGTVTLPAGSVTYTALPSEAANTLLGNPTGSAASTTTITLGTGLAFSSGALTISSPLPSGLTIPGATINGASAIGGTTTINTSGAITTTGGLTTSGGTANINSTSVGSPQNTNIDAGTATGGTVTIGNATSTTTFAGTVTFPAGSTGFETFRAKSADVVLTPSNTTLQVDPDLQLASLQSSATYEFSGVINYDASGTGGTTAADLKLALYFTGTATSIRWSVNQGGTAVSPSSVSGNSASPSTAVAITGFHVDPVAAGNTQSIFVSGVIVVAAAGTGTLEVEEAQNTSQAATTTIRANSFIRAIRVQ
jgi:fibronectin-binding autotransporter adhesin